MKGLVEGGRVFPLKRKGKYKDFGIPVPKDGG